MKEIAGCPDCGELRFDPVKIEDNCDMLLKCRKCGKTLVVKNMWTPGVPDRNGDVISKEAVDKFRKQLDERQVS